MPGSSSCLSHESGSSVSAPSVLTRPVLPAPYLCDVHQNWTVVQCCACTVCIVYCVSRVPAHMGLALLCSQPGSYSHRLESTLHFTFSDSYRLVFAPLTASCVGLITPCDTLQQVLPVVPSFWMWKSLRHGL